MKSANGKSVVVTGASTGIGWGTVKVLVAGGFRVFGSVRKAQDGAKLAAEFGPAFTPLVFDVTDRAAIAAGAAKVAAALGGETLSGLVNNAGIAVAGLLVYMTPEEIGEQLAVNVQGPLNVTQAFLPLLGTDKNRKGKPGRIVMMSSVGGTSATPFMGAYNTSKFALEGMSEALRRELMLFGIDVLVVAPGPIKTPIWTKSKAMTDPRYTEGPYAKVLEKMKLLMKDAAGGGLEPEAVGEVVLAILTAARPPTRKVITPTRVQHFLQNRLPKRWIDGMMARMLDLKP
jgi:NAD(P)-dependent dehydrogenase (short-subunit alcohol dehydrogenase family)